MFFMFPVFTSLVSLVSPLAFYKVPLKILPRVYCAKAKEKLLGYARARSLKDGLPTWRFKDSNCKGRDTLRGDAGFAYAALSMGFFYHFEAGERLRSSE